MAKHAIFNAKAPEEWLDDIVQNMLLLLQVDVRHEPGLHYNFASPPEDFDRWYGRVLYFLSLEALRNFRVNERPHAELDPAERDADRSAAHDLSLDIDSFIASRPDPLRTVLTLLRAGYDRKEITARTRLSQSTLCRLIAGVRGELRRWVDGAQGADETRLRRGE